MKEIIQKLLASVDKKMLVKWAGAMIIGALAAFFGMQTTDFKEALCGAPQVAVPAPLPALEIKK